MDAPKNAADGGAIAAAGSRRARESSAPTWLEALGGSGILKILILAGLLAWMYSDHLVRLYQYWQEPDWSHGFFIPFATLYFIHLKRDEILGRERRGSWAGLFLMLFSTAVYTFAIRSKFGYPQPLSIITMIAGIVLLTCGWRTFWLTLFPVAFLALAMPPPERLYREITQPLQQGAAYIATLVLNSLPGADVERAGVNISYWMKGHQPGSFTVAGACSGMRSLMAFVALGLTLAYVTPRPFWHRVAMACAVVPVALFCNAIRVIVTGVFQMYEYGNLAVGTPHMLLGLTTFALGFAIYMGILWLLDNLFVDAELADGPPSRGAAS